jgi:2-alkenal reductase
MIRFLTRFTNVLLLIIVAALLAWPYIRPALLAEDAPRAVAPRGDLGIGEQATVALFSKVSPSVVHVFAEAPANRFQGAGQEAAPASGTGFIWDRAGHVVTNNHVVENAGAVRIRLGDGRIVPATVIGRAPNADLAVLRLQGATALPEPIAVGSSADLQVGQAALAIGNPFGLDQTLTTGVISALRRRLPTDGGREIADVIQTDAAINPGNSGGPLLDSGGRLIGVNTAIYSPSGASAGIGFAIPVDTVNRIVPQLIRDGRVPSPAIGVALAGEGAAQRIGVEGLVILDVAPGGPAARAGLRGVDRAAGTLGDILVAADGRPLRRLADLVAALEARGVGAALPLTVLRAGRPQTVTVEIGDAQEGR